MGYEGPEVFRVPAASDDAQENLQNTVLEGVPIETARRHADDPPVSDGVVRLWGTTSSNEGSWKKVDAGDYLIFYRTGTYSHAAKVLGTEVNERLAREVWPNFDDEPWSHVIYLDEPNRIDASSADLHELAAYGRDHTQQFSSLNDLGLGGIRGKYGSVEAFAEGRPSAHTDVDDVAPPDEAERVVDVRRVPDFDLDDDLLDGLYFPDGVAGELLDQVESSLAAGKHVVFTGPPGTGKTELARRVCAALVDAHDGVYSDYQITTATADWSTFETVGGYMPAESTEDEDELTFEPGQVLRRFKRDGAQRNELLVVDELNRADIDKAFGQLFTLLSGQAVQLPYRRDGEEIVIRPASDAEGQPAPHEYVMPESWRLLATMNTYDKTSLYELSYAFMRRFAFVHVPAPEVPERRSERVRLLRRYAAAWDLEPDDETLDAVSQVWRALNDGEADRKVGPAIVEDVLRSVAQGRHADAETAVTAAVSNYVLPQLEGSPNQRQIVQQLLRVDGVDRSRLGARASDVLQVAIDG